MATKQLKALKDFRYGTRMMRAGDPVEMDGPTARLYTALGAVAEGDATPKASRAAQDVRDDLAQSQLGASGVSAPPAPKRTTRRPRRKTAAKKA